MDPDPSSLSSSVSQLQSFFDSASDPAFALITLGLLGLLVTLALLLKTTELTLFSSAEPIASRLRDGAGQRLSRLIERGRSLRVAFFVLNTTVIVAAGLIAALLAGTAAQSLGIDVRVVLLVEIMTLAVIVVATAVLAPRTLSPARSEAVSRSMALPLAATYRVISPATHLLARSSDFFRERMLKGSRRVSSEEIKTMADLGQEHGTLEESERELIHSIVEFGTMTVREVMVSRLDIVALPVTADVQEAVEIIRDSGHSRLPLYIEHLDNIAGIIYAKDLLPHLGNGQTGPLNWTRLARAPMFVPASKKLDELLRDFQARKTHIAIVVDEYGGTAGLVTLEDLLEEIVGDIRDEHDEGEAPMIEPLGTDSYRVDARVNLDDLNEELGISIDTDRFDFETLGGLIFHLTGAIPEEGEEVTFENLSLRVETVDNHRIGYVLVRIGSEGERDETSDRE